MRLQNKVAVVTGAGSGMGKAISLLYAKEGAKVVVSDINESTAQAVADEIKAAGGEATVVRANVAEESDIQNLIDTTVDTYGTVDILVNNAGIMDGFEPAGEVQDERWERVFAINTTSVMRSTRKVLPIFQQKQSGVIINVASNGGLNGGRAGAAYIASKHAVIGFTKSTGFMYAKEGIRCNAIAPGAVETNISASMGAPSPFGASRIQPGMALLPRLGKSEEIAQIALFLGSDDSSLINGTVIVADAGWSSY